MPTKNHCLRRGIKEYTFCNYILINPNASVDKCLLLGKVVELLTLFYKNVFIKYNIVHDWQKLIEHSLR